MNIYKKWSEILKANKGSSLSYDSKSEEFVITFTGNDGFRIPGNCVYCGEHISRKTPTQLFARLSGNNKKTGTFNECTGFTFRV